VHFFLRFGTRPGHFFGGLGLGVLTIGSLMLAYLGVLKMLGQSVGGRPLLSLGFFLMMGGLQLITTGVLAELLMRIYYDGGHARPYHTRQGDEPAAHEDWHA
jgi:hypothetical protein